MGKDASRPKLLDVARHAQVSPATVSRVIHSTAPVRENARARVLASMSALGYESKQFKPVAFRNVVAVLIPDLLNPFFAEMVRRTPTKHLAFGSKLHMDLETDNRHILLHGVNFGLTVYI